MRRPWQKIQVAPQKVGLHERSQMGHDTRLRHAWRHFYHDLYQRVGDESQFSPGFFTDLWAYLTNEIPTVHLIWLYFVFEVLYILFFAFLLSVSHGIAPMGWTRCLIASARSVTMLANWSSSQFSFVEQGQQQEVVHAVGAVLLIFEGFLHFLFVCVASSLIIVRSLRPLQQVAFSHHCVLTDDELTLRIRILRPHSTVLIRPTPPALGF